MAQRDIIGLVVSYVFAFGLLAITTFVQRWRHYPQEFTRKIVHIGAGMWIFGILALFENWYWGIVPTATFIVFNYISYKFKLIKAMDLDDDTPGTVYFAFSITLLLAVFWSREQAWIAVVGVMAMTWGDAFASIIGRGWGKHRYFVARHQRSFEGSAAMFGFSCVAILLVLSLFQTGLDALQIVSFSVFVSLVATFVEAISLRGLDNIFVPLGSSLILFVLVSNPVSIPRIWLGLLISLGIGVLAYSRKSLTFSGVLGAIITGTLIFGFGGWVWGLALIAFFVYGTALSKFKERQKEQLAADKFDKGSQRDIGQALANGGVGAVLAVAFFLSSNPVWLFAAFVGVMATVNADTWATEIGSALGGRPIDIRTGRRTEAGTSGAISLPGTAAALAGAALLGLFASGLPAFLIVTLAGFGGALYDTLLGATVQALWRDPSDPEQWTEKAQVGPPGRGVRLIGNDTVNFLCTLTAVGLAAGLARLF